MRVLGFFDSLLGSVDNLDFLVGVLDGRILLFSRNKRKQSETFDFLGFEFSRDISRNCKPIIKRRTSRKKLRNSIAGFTEWIKTNRNKKISKIMTTLKSKYRGYWNCYGVIGNYDSLETFYYRTVGILFKWLNRRSQRLSYNWTGFKEFLKQFSIPVPKITEKYPSKQLKLFVQCSSMRKWADSKSPVRENRTPGSVRGRSGNWPFYLYSINPPHHNC